MTYDPGFFHTGARELQDRFGSRALADRIVERLARDQFTPEMREFIQQRSMFFLASADDLGRPDCSYKGGVPGFVRVLDPVTLEFPSYDGNGMFRSLGNIRVNPRVGLLFIDFESPRRLRVNGRASIDTRADAIAAHPGAQAVVRVVADAIFPNCPRYVHRQGVVELSVFAPREGHVPPTPEWKTRPEFHDVVPPVTTPDGGAATGATRRDPDPAR